MLWARTRSTCVKYDIMTLLMLCRLLTHDVTDKCNLDRILYLVEFPLVLK